MPALLSFPRFFLLECEQKGWSLRSHLKPWDSRASRWKQLELLITTKMLTSTFLYYETPKLNHFKPQLNEAFLLSIAEFNLYWY